MDIKTQIDGLTEVEAKAALAMNGGYIPLCPEMFKGDKGSMGVRPLPCVRDEHGAIKEQTVKSLLAKINEELDELKQALVVRKYFLDMDEHVAEEAADTITAITTLEEALGIDAEMRNKAQERVNQKNFERARL